MEFLETLPPVQLYAVGALVAVVSLLVLRVVSNNLTGKAPPIMEGIPFVGGLFKFIKGPWFLMSEGYTKYGEIFTVPVLHRRITFLIGPDVAPHFFKATDEELSQKEVYGYSVPSFGPGVVYDVDLKIRVEQFRFFAEALKKERLKSYVPHFVHEAEQFFANWGDEGVIDFADEFNKLITLTAARTLLGREVREQMFEQVSGLLHDLDDGMMPISVVSPYLPIARHRTRDKARVEVGKIFAKVIQARRASGVREEDVLQQFIDARYQNVYDGRPMNEQEITGLLIASLFAGQHTSSITAAWAGYHITEYKPSWDACVAEQQSIIASAGPAITFETLASMETLQRNIMESLRLHPPLILVLRYVRVPFTVTTRHGKEYTVPKGDVVAASPNFSHRLAHVFESPDEFCPDRFLPPRDEDKRPYAFIGFGGGRHGCIGSNFAYLQMKTLWTVLLRNFEFEPLGPIPTPNYEAMVVGPKPGLTRYRRRKVPIA